MESPSWKTPLPGDPVATAEAFAASYRGDGLRLDFSIESLASEVERIRVLPVFGARMAQRPSSEVEEAAEVGLGAYVGESLRRSFSGVWHGEFFPTCWIFNYYRSRVVFGEYKLNPYNLYPDIKVGDLLAYVLPSIRARREWKLEKDEQRSLDRAVCKATLKIAPETWDTVVLRIVRRKGEKRVGAFDHFLSSPVSAGFAVHDQALREATGRLDERHRHFGGFLGYATYSITRKREWYTYTLDWAYDWDAADPSDL